MHVQRLLDRLEQFAARHGAPVVRDSLDGLVSGRVEECRIVLRRNMSAEQQLLTLVHELTHLIAHYNVTPRVDRTICEYEADAVERLVGAKLGLTPDPGAAIEDEVSATDDLLACSVIRVQWAARAIVSAARHR